MRKSRKLRALGSQISLRLGRLIALERTIPNADTTEAIRLTGYVAIDALAAWSAFSREYVLGCLWLDAYSETVGVVSHSLKGQVGSERAAIIESVRAVKKPGWSPADDYEITPFDEPVWRKGQTLMRIAESFQFSNLDQIKIAFSYQGTALDELPVVRNFFAHKDKQTIDLVRQLGTNAYSVPPVPAATDLVTTILPGRTDTLLSEWLHNMWRTGNALCV
jgi:hypothetical protein